MNMAPEQTEVRTYHPDTRDAMDAGRRFVNDVDEHELRIIRDTGVDRHLHFARKDGSFSYWFEILTWDGRLAIHGDMGTFVFSRTTDMFEFFRSARPLDDPYRINPGYWGEKLRGATHGRDQVTTFSVERLKLDLRTQLEESFHERYGELADWPAHRREDLKLEVERLMDDMTEDHPSSLDEARAFRYEHPPTAPGDREYKFRFRLEDAYSGDFTAYGYHFLWCCHAIAWAVDQYDAHHAAKEGEAQVTMTFRATVTGDQGPHELADVVRFHVGLSELDCLEVDISAVTITDAKEGTRP